jgi:Mrp family chromosome partitioning ATPase
MSTFVDLLPQTLDAVCKPETIEVEPQESCQPGVATWDSDSFGEEQIRGLVRQVFLPGWPKPAHQVVFSPVDPETDVSTICMQVGLALSTQVSGTTCLVEANPGSPGLEAILETNGLDLVPNQESSALRDSSRRLSSQLWLVPRHVFLAEDANGCSGGRLRDRLRDLRQTFDYTVLCGPPAATCNEAALLASLCDGMVLVLQANSTRRVTAQRVKEKLHSANARLLGAVLSERTFPIPEAIYRKW